MTSEINKDEDFASDSDESDEDFRPNETGESAVSEEESDGCENEEVNQAGVDDNDDGEASRRKKKNVRKGKKLTKKASKKKESKSNDDSAEEEDDNGNDKLSRCRRTTRQTEDLYTNGQKKSVEKDELESDGEDKSRENALWADFLKDVGPPLTKTSKAVTQTKPSTSSSTNGKVNVGLGSKKPEEKSKTDQDIKKVNITEVLDFAGEEVRIQKQVDISSIKENKATALASPKLQPFGRIMPGAGIKRVAVAGSSKGGIGSVLNKITKKQKISVLDKSQMDWKSFKQEEGIDETLQTYNKGKDGYLERQDFLQRTDLRQFEIEKNLRQTSRRPH